MRTGLLDGMRLHHVSAACLVFGRVSLFGPRRRLSTLSEHELYMARQEGFDILCEGAPAIRRLFNGLMVDSVERFTRSHTVTGTLGHIFDWLDRVARDEPDLDQLRTIVAEQAFAIFPMAGGEVLFGVTNINPPMLTVHDVERRYGVNWIAATRVATLAGVLNHLRIGKMPGPKVIQAPEAERLFAHFIDVISITALAREVGATQKQLMALVDAGHLKPAFDRRDVLMSFWRPDVERFLQSLAVRAVPSPQREQRMASVRRAAWRSAPKFLALVNAILDGRLGWIGRLADGEFFQALLVRRDDVAEVLDGTNSVQKDAGSFHQMELCERWKVKSEAVAELVMRRILVADTVGSRGRRFQIRRDSAEQFEQTYISVKCLALHHDGDWRTMKGTVERRGIRPAFVGLRGCFYRRDELQQASLI